MEHPCYRCGEPVVDATPFCPACGAPQIRVAAREPQISAEASGSEAAVAPHAIDSVTAPAAPSHSGQIQWKIFFRLALPLAAAVGFLTSIQSPWGLLVVLPGGTMLAISLYRRRQLATLTTWAGARLGLFMGLLSFAFFLLFFGVRSAADVAAYRQEMAKLAEQAMAQPTPEAQQLAQAWFGGPHSIVVMTAVLAISTLFFLLVVAGVAGGLMGALLRRRIP